MLAGIDSDVSEDQSTQQSHMGNSTRSPLAEISSNHQKSIHGSIKSKLSHGFEDSDSEDGSPVRPRGRLAAQLSLHSDESRQREPSPESPKEGTAYERIRKRLLTDKSINKIDHGMLGTQSRSSEVPIDSTISTPFAPGGEFPRHVSDPPTSGSKIQEFTDSRHLSDSDDDRLPDHPLGSTRFLELVAKKRAEREAREAEEESKKQEKLAKARDLERDLSDASPALSDDEVDRRLTQRDRPARKASKKAIEEMNRETQRMSRNMQLAHQAKTKKKISKESFFAKFNFQQPIVNDQQQPLSSSATSSRPVSDAEQARDPESPPTSPIEPDGTNALAVRLGEQSRSALEASGATDLEHTREFPELADIFSASSSVRAKPPPAEASHPANEGAYRTFGGKKKPLRSIPKFRLPTPSASKDSINLDSDTDSDSVKNRQSRKPMKDVYRLDAFKQRPIDKATDNHSLLKLRALAHLNSPKGSSRLKKQSVNLIDMQNLLQKRARQQALDERRAKVEELKARGVYIPTTEEREKDQASLEDMLEKGRREAEELRQEEQRARKENKIANGDLDNVSGSDEEDEDYHEGEEEADAEFSGSEEEEDETDGSEDDRDPLEQDELLVTQQKNQRPQQGLVEDEASEDAEEEDEELEKELEGEREDIVQDPELDLETSDAIIRKPRAKQMVIEDDEDEEVVGTVSDRSAATMPPTSANALTPTKLEAYFGMGDSNIESLGLTQAFAATMANSQNVNNTQKDQDDMILPDAPPEPIFPSLDHQDSIQTILDSQDCATGHNTLDILDGCESGQVILDFTQSQARHATGAESQSQLQAPLTQLSQMPDPTQDAGFIRSSSAPERFVDAPPSTVDTVILTESLGTDSPIKKRGRLYRRSIAASGSDDESDAANENAQSIEQNAFALMKQKRRQAAAESAFDKKKSEAKEMVEEQAQESEDEYAGLGGASDDESGGEEDEEIQKMMDHEKVDIDERALAALHA